MRSDVGRPAWVLAVDIGGTKVDAALVSADGLIAPGSRHRESTGSNASRDQIAASVRSVIRRALDGAGSVVGAGVGCAGPVSTITGTVAPLNLPAWRDYPLENLVAEASGLPTTVRLDGLCIALAERWLGALRACRNGMAMVVSTGIGGGIVSDGRLVGGHSGNAGHIGQIAASTDGEDDTGYSTLEEVASGPNAVAWARRRGWEGRSGEELGVAFAAGDPIAVAAVTRCINAVGDGISSAAALLDLEVVAIGGGFSRVTPDFVDRVASRFALVNPLPSLRGLRIVPAELGGDASLLGAAGLIHRADLLPG